MRLALSNMASSVTIRSTLLRGGMHPWLSYLGLIDYRYPFDSVDTFAAAIFQSFQFVVQEATSGASVINFGPSPVPSTGYYGVC